MESFEEKVAALSSMIKRGEIPTYKQTAEVRNHLLKIRLHNYWAYGKALCLLFGHVGIYLGSLINGEVCEKARTIAARN